MDTNRILENIYNFPEMYVPQGLYCYTYINSTYLRCLFWDMDSKHHHQNNGYCHLIGKGDWQLDGGLLWDQCKECDINTNIEIT